MNLENFGIAKRNLLQLISSGSKAEIIAKSHNNAERFEFNKKFPAIKKKFLETYGFDNKNINERDVISFIEDFDQAVIVKTLNAEPLGTSAESLAVVGTPLIQSKNPRIN